jgi:hypothetical protein
MLFYVPYFDTMLLEGRWLSGVNNVEELSEVRKGNLHVVIRISYNWLRSGSARYFKELLTVFWVPKLY